MNASAQVETEYEKTMELHLGEKMVMGNYTVEVFNFPPPVEGYTPINKNTSIGERKEIPAVPVNPFVGVRLYYDTTAVEEWYLIEGENESYNFKAWVTIEKLPEKNAQIWINKYYNPTAKIRINIKQPILITFDTKPVIKPPSTIEIQAKVKGSNEDILYPSLNLWIDTKLVKKEGILTWYRLNNSDILKKDEEVKFNITYDTPLISDQENYNVNITAEATWQDINNKKYNQLYTTNLTILVHPKWNFTIQKLVNNELNIRNDILVTVSIQNTGIGDIELEVNDVLPSNFTLLSGNLTWRPKIKSGDSWVGVYKMKAPYPMTVDMPHVNATYRTALKNYSIESGNSVLNIIGAYIIINKSFPQEWEVNNSMNVTLNVSNKGDRYVIVEFSDVIPEEASLVSGNLSERLLLPSGEKKILNYVIKFQNAGLFEVPAAKALYYDQQLRITAISNVGIINITAAAINTPIPVNKSLSGNMSEKVSVNVSNPDTMQEKIEAESLLSGILHYNVTSILYAVISIIFVLFIILYAIYKLKNIG